MNLKVGDLAKLTGKTVRALRYYEELGLVKPIQRTKGGFRLYDQTEVNRIRLIDKFHELGFSLEEIAEIVEAYRGSMSGDEAAQKLRPMLQKSLEVIKRKIGILEEFGREIETSLGFVHSCCQCVAKPEASKCVPCDRGTHNGKLPYFINQLL